LTPEQFTETFAIEAVTRSESHSRQQPAVLVAIPAYNESETIGDVVTEATKYADEVLVVDDGSDDATADVARKAGAEVIEHQRNSGYGQSLKTIFSAASDRDAQSLVILDADGQHDPADIPKLVEELEGSGAELVIGSRFERDGESDLPLYRWFGLKMINVLTNLSLGLVRRRSRVSDTQSGFRAYSPAAIDSLARDESIAQDMGASTDILHHAHKHNYRIAEVGTTVSYSVDNASSQNPVSHGLTLVSNILQTIERERPVMTFGVPGFLLTLVGFVLGYWSVANYVSTEIFPAGVAVSAVFAILIGLLACFTAIILHSLTVHFDTELARHDR
jgi:glycosyltransferase involved in cell wall biosynthesis